MSTSGIENAYRQRLRREITAGDTSAQISANVSLGNTLDDVKQAETQKKLQDVAAKKQEDALLLHIQAQKEKQQATVALTKANELNAYQREVYLTLLKNGEIMPEMEEAFGVTRNVLEKAVDHYNRKKAEAAAKAAQEEAQQDPDNGFPQYVNAGESNLAKDIKNNALKNNQVFVQGPHTQKNAADISGQQKLKSELMRFKNPTKQLEMVADASVETVTEKRIREEKQKEKEAAERETAVSYKRHSDASDAAVSAKRKWADSNKMSIFEKQSFMMNANVFDSVLKDVGFGEYTYRQNMHFMKERLKNPKEMLTDEQSALLDEMCAMAEDDDLYNELNEIRTENWGRWADDRIKKLVSDKKSIVDSAEDETAKGLAQDEYDLVCSAIVRKCQNETSAKMTNAMEKINLMSSVTPDADKAAQATKKLEEYRKKIATPYDEAFEKYCAGGSSLEAATMKHLNNEFAILEEKRVAGGFGSYTEYLEAQIECVNEVYKKIEIAAFRVERSNTSSFTYDKIEEIGIEWTKLSEKLDAKKAALEKEKEEIEPIETAYNDGIANISKSYNPTSQQDLAEKKEQNYRNMRFYEKQIKKATDEETKAALQAELDRTKSLEKYYNDISADYEHKDEIARQYGSTYKGVDIERAAEISGITLDPNGDVDQIQEDLVKKIREIEKRRPSYDERGTTKYLEELIRAAKYREALFWTGYYSYDEETAEKYTRHQFSAIQADIYEYSDGKIKKGLGMYELNEKSFNEFKKDIYNFVFSEVDEERISNNPVGADLLRKVEKNVEMAKQEVKIFEEFSKTQKDYDDNFWGQFAANTTSGFMSIDKSLAWADAMNDPENEEKKKYAESLTYISDLFYNENADVMNADRGWLSNSIAKDFASNIGNQTYQLLNGAGWALVGAAAGLFVGAPQIGAKIGYVAGSAGYGYRVAAGAAYETAIAQGATHAVAKAAATDEGILNSIIESGGAILDVIPYGVALKGAKGVAKFGKAAVEKTALDVARVGIMSVSKEAAEKKLTSTVKKLAKGFLRYGINIASEGLEEGLQESVSIATEKRIADGGAGNVFSHAGESANILVDILSGADQENAERFWESVRGGVAVAFVGSVFSTIDIVADQKKSMNEAVIMRRLGDIVIQTGQQKNVLETAAAELESGSVGYNMANRLLKRIKRSNEDLKNFRDELGAIMLLVANNEAEAKVVDQLNTAGFKGKQTVAAGAIIKTLAGTENLSAREKMMTRNSKVTKLISEAEQGAEWAQDLVKMSSDFVSRVNAILSGDVKNTLKAAEENETKIIASQSEKEKPKNDGVQDRSREATELSFDTENIRVHQDAETNRQILNRMMLWVIDEILKKNKSIDQKALSVLNQYQKNAVNGSDDIAPMQTILLINDEKLSLTLQHIVDEIAAHISEVSPETASFLTDAGVSLEDFKNHRYANASSNELFNRRAENTITMLISLALQKRGGDMRRIGTVFGGMDHVKRYFEKIKSRIASDPTGLLTQAEIKTLDDETFELLVYQVTQKMGRDIQEETGLKNTTTELFDSEQYDRVSLMEEYSAIETLSNEYTLSEEQREVSKQIGRDLDAEKIIENVGRNVKLAAEENLSKKIKNRIIFEILKAVNEDPTKVEKLNAFVFPKEIIGQIVKFISSGEIASIDEVKSIGIEEANRAIRTICSNLSHHITALPYYADTQIDLDIFNDIDLTVMDFERSPQTQENDNKKKTKKHFLENFMYGMVDTTFKLDQISRRTGNDMIETIALHGKRRFSIIDTCLQRRFETPDGVVLGDSFESAKKEIVAAAGSEELANEYLILWCHVDRCGQGKAALANVTKEEAQARINAIEADHPDIRSAAQKVWDYDGNLLKIEQLAGFRTEEEVKRMREMYPHHVTLRLDLGENISKKKISKGNKDNFISANSSVGYIEGMFSDMDSIVNVFDTLRSLTISRYREYYEQWLASELYNTYKVLEVKSKNDPKAEKRFTELCKDIRFILDRETLEEKQLINFFKENGERIIHTQDKDGRNYITFYDAENGYTAMEVTEHLFKSFASIDNEYSQTLLEEYIPKWTERAWKWFAGQFRNAVTQANPFFAIRNFCRDLQSALLYSKNTKRFARNIFRAGKEMLEGGEYFELFQNHGGGENAYFGKKGYERVLEKMQSRKGFLKVVADLSEGLSSAMDKTAVTKIAKQVFQAARISKINQFIETLPRMAEFITTLEEEFDGKIDRVSLATAMRNAADITVDFNRGGMVGRALNRAYIPFFNAGVQGTYRLVRQFMQPSLKAYMKLAGKIVALGIAPTLLNNLMYGDDEEYEKLTDYAKDSYFLFKIGDGLWLKLPKGRELTLFSSAAWRIYDGVKNEEFTFEDLYSYLGALGSAYMPTGTKGENIFKNATSALFDNRSWYGGIIDYEKEYNPNDAAYQNKDSTTDDISEWLAWISSKIPGVNLSPKQWQVVLQSYGGFYADIIIPMLTDKEEKGFFLNEFTIDSTYSNRLAGDFYDTLEKHQRRGSEITNKKREVSQVCEKFLNDYKQRIGDLNDEIEKIQASDADGKRKTEETDAIKKQINNLYIECLSQIDDYEEAVSDFLNDSENDGDNRIKMAKIAADYETMGAEYALKNYNSELYEKAKKATSGGISYDDYCAIYFNCKDIDGIDGIDGSKRNAVLRKAEGLGYTKSETLEVFPALRTTYEEYAACRRESTGRVSFAAAFSQKQLEKADFLFTKYNISYDTFVDLLRMYNDETDQYYFKGKGKKSHFLSVSKEKYGLTEKQANAAYSAVK